MTVQFLDLKSISNARQLDAYRGADGKRIKSKLLIRSGALYNASIEDLNKLVNLYGLSTIIDLRNADETKHQPDPQLPNVKYYSLSVMGEDSANSLAIVEIYRQYQNNVGKAYVEMIRQGALVPDMYTNFFDSTESMQAYRKFFDILLSEQGTILWHCTGGKDRTGLATVMLLAILGIDEKTILKDFALINEINRKKINYIRAEASKYTADEAELKQIEALAGVFPPYMQKVFDRAKAESGSILSFIQEKLGLTNQEIICLREKFLE